MYRHVLRPRHVLASCMQRALRCWARHLTALPVGSIHYRRQLWRALHFLLLFILLPSCCEAAAYRYHFSLDTALRGNCLCDATLTLAIPPSYVCMIAFLPPPPCLFATQQCISFPFRSLILCSLLSNDKDTDERWPKVLCAGSSPVDHTVVHPSLGSRRTHPLAGATPDCVIVRRYTALRGGLVRAQ